MHICQNLQKDLHAVPLYIVRCAVHDSTNSVCRIALKFVSSPQACQTETRDCTPVDETGPRRRSRPERGLTSDHDSREA